MLSGFATIQQMINEVCGKGRLPALLRLAGVCFLLLCLRRGAQLVSPQVWDEDGIIIGGFVEHGVLSLLHPVNGYLVLVPKLISLPALKTSFYYYPEVSTYLCWLFIIGTLLAVARAPTLLRGGIALAVFTLLIPSDAEAIGIPLYTFWWSGLLLFLVVLWDNTPRDWITRFVFIVLGGLSSPLIILLLPLFWFRAVFYRKHEILLAATATLCAGVQGYFLATAARPVGTGAMTFDTALFVARRFLGHYLIGNLLDSPAPLLIAGLLTLAAAGLFLYRQRRSPALWLLASLWLGTVALTVYRVDAAGIQPSFDGSRYVFFPYILESWFLLQVVLLTPSRLGKILPAAMLALSAINAVPVLSRSHDDLHWRQQLANCLDFDRYQIPIQFDGHASLSWRLDITSDRCRELLDRSWIGPAHLAPTMFPYTTMTGADSPAATVAMLAQDKTVASAELNSDYAMGLANGLLVYGPRRLPNSDQSMRGSITLRLRKGDRIYFLGGVISNLGGVIAHQVGLTLGGRTDTFYGLPPSLAWRIIEFSNRRLPEEFSVTIANYGAAPGEWFAVGLQH